METIKIISVNISQKKGTIKTPYKQIKITADGVENDAHAGDWNRQISLLGTESIEKYNASTNTTIQAGEFAENITTQGFPLYTLHPLDRISSNEIELEVTQIGKVCHGKGCNIFKETGDCIMPTEGIFCRVIKKGILKKGDTLNVIPKLYNISVITLSDRASKGQYEDVSGKVLVDLITNFFTSQNKIIKCHYYLIPDDAEELKNLLNILFESDTDAIFTSGGTGIGPRDITPDVIKSIIDKEITGIMDYVRLKYGAQFPGALISRSIAGVKGKTLIYALPGNPKAVKEYCEEIFKTLQHSIYMIHGIDKH